MADLGTFPWGWSSTGGGASQRRSTAHLATLSEASQGSDGGQAEVRKGSCGSQTGGGQRSGSERHTHAGVLQAHGEDALVDLVELHQLQEVDEERQAVVHGEVLPASLLAL